MLSNCVQKNNPSTPVAPKQPAGELAFLLNYKGQLPGNVGFLSNHITQRRLANLLRGEMDLEQLKAFTAHEVPLETDTVLWCVHALYSSETGDTITTITADALNDCIKLTIQAKGETLLHKADRDICL